LVAPIKVVDMFDDNFGHHSFGDQNYLITKVRIKFVLTKIDFGYLIKRWIDLYH
jgi:hypothetical protein